MASNKKSAEKDVPANTDSQEKTSHRSGGIGHFLKKILKSFPGNRTKKQTYKEILSEEPEDSRSLNLPIEQLLVTGTAAILTLAAFLVLLMTSILTPNQAQVQQSVERVGKQATFQLQLALWQAKRMAEKISSHPQVIDFLGSSKSMSNPDQLSKLTSLVSRGIPYGSAMFLVNKDTIGTLPPSLGFTALDLSRRSLRGEHPKAEASQAGNKWQLFTSSPIIDKNSVIGSVLLILDMSILQTPMVLTDKGIGQILVFQDQENRSQPILSTGTPTPKSEYSWKIDLEGTPWAVVFHPSEQFLDDVRRSPVPALIAMLIAMTSVLGVSFHTAYIVRRKVNDYFANSILEHERLGPESTRLKYSIHHSNDQDDSKAVLSDIEAIPESIFRAHDIRGVVGQTLTESTMTLIGRAIGSAAVAKDERTILIANDGRLSSPMLKVSLVVGLVSSGCKVVSVGMVPTPILYFAIQTLKADSGIMITGSHSPADYNGVKVILKGRRIHGKDIKDLYRRIKEQDFEAQKTGTSEEMTSRYLRHVSSAEVSPHYIDQILDDINLSRPLKVVVDCGNGVAGRFAPQLFEKLGCEVISIYCNIDGTFPNHSPNPCDPENLKELIEKVIATEADLGIALDGDGDRVNLVSSTGVIVSPDRVMMILARDIISRHPKADIVVDAACSHHLIKVIKENGGQHHMCRTGHTVIRDKIKETEAFLAGDISGHIFINERWYGFDDAIYCAARLLEYFTDQDKSLNAILKALPSSVCSPEIRIHTTEENKKSLIEYLENRAEFKGGNKCTIDGIRVDYPWGWGMVRASRITPELVLRFEADNNEELDKIKGRFREQLLTADPELKISF